MTKPQTPKKDEVVEPLTPEGTGGEPTPKETTPPVETPPTEDENYKKKFGESTAENQRIMAENQRLAQEKADLEEKLDKTNEALSEKELENNIPDFDLMSPEEQREAKQNEINKKRITILEAKQKWNDDFANMVVSLSPEMREKLNQKGGEMVFKKFACSPENAGQKNLLNLVKQFLFEEITPEPEPKPVVPGLEDGSGGDHLPPAPPKKGYTAAEAAELRRKKPQEYSKLVQEGKMIII